MKTLHDILKQSEQVRFATDTGIKMHKKLQCIMISGGVVQGDAELVKQILARPELLLFFCANSRTEVPIAGIINGRFVSRRIDRMVVDVQKRTVFILDYKTDTDSGVYHDKYVAQINEYVALLRAIYPGYAILGYILWTRDFSLEKI